MVHDAKENLEGNPNLCQNSPAPVVRVLTAGQILLLLWVEGGISNDPRAPKASIRQVVKEALRKPQAHSHGLPMAMADPKNGPLEGHVSLQANDSPKVSCSFWKVKGIGTSEALDGHSSAWKICCGHMLELRPLIARQEIFHPPENSCAAHTPCPRCLHQCVTHCRNLQKVCLNSCDKQSKQHFIILISP